MILLTLVPYVLVPLLITLLFKWLKIPTKFTWLTFIITSAIIFFYPIAFNKIDKYYNPPAPVHCVDCGMVFVTIFMANLFVLLPITIFIQTVFNKRLGIKYKGKNPIQ